MRVSGFTFLRNGQLLGYPFVQSIRSILPIVDEFIIALGPCEDDTREILLGMNEPKLRIVETQWNQNLRNDYSIRGFNYGQQKSIALFNCTGDWAFYLEGDEIVHEEDLPAIRRNMERYQNDSRVESLVFDYLHFYGNTNTQAWSPRWYRRAPRIIKTSIPVWAPKGLFFLVLKSSKKGRYPHAAHSGGRIFHYGYVRTEETFQAKYDKTEIYWRRDKSIPERKKISYGQVDPVALRPFNGSHPGVIEGFFPTAEGPFSADPNYRPTKRDLRHRVTLQLEKWFGFELNHNHFSWAKGCGPRRASTELPSENPSRDPFPGSVDHRDQRSPRKMGGRAVEPIR